MKKLMKVQFDSKKEKEDFASFLRGEITTREIGKRLGMSHQNAINLIGLLVLSAVKEGKIKTEDLLD